MNTRWDQAVNWVDSVTDFFKNDEPENRVEREPAALVPEGESVKVLSRLEKALVVYDRQSFGALPEKSLFFASKVKCQQELDRIMDEVIDQLEDCEASDCRTRMIELQAEIAAANERIASHRAEALSRTRSRAEANPLMSVIKGYAGLDGRIEDQRELIEERKAEVEEVRQRFRTALARIGLVVTAEEADTLLLPVQEGVVSMTAAIHNASALTGQLETLVEISGEAPLQTRRYYGIYVLLVYAIDRLHLHALEEIDSNYLPRIQTFELEARQNMASAEAQIRNGGPKDQLRANIESSKTTLQGCRLLADVLGKQRRTIAAGREQTGRIFAATANTYRTAHVSLNLAKLISDSQGAFLALRRIQIPQLRAFQSLELKAEVQRLADRIAGE